jgi:hypothetical protein
MGTDHEQHKYRSVSQKEGSLHFLLLFASRREILGTVREAPQLFERNATDDNRILDVIEKRRQEGET